MRKMRKLIGIAILVLIAVAILIAMIDSIGWDGAIVAILTGGVLAGLILFAIWLIMGG